MLVLMGMSSEIINSLQLRYGSGMPCDIVTSLFEKAELKLYTVTG